MFSALLPMEQENAEHVDRSAKGNVSFSERFSMGQNFSKHGYYSNRKYKFRGSPVVCRKLFALCHEAPTKSAQPL